MLTPSYLGPADVDHVVGFLQDRSNALPIGDFPVDPALAKQPGLYAWWADEDGLSALDSGLGCVLDPLIYAGLAGATHWPSGKQSTATLMQRVRGLHLHGNVRGSTFRRTLAAILREPLQLHVAGPNKLTKESEQTLSTWMVQHLFVAVLPYPDRDALGLMETAILDRLGPPLNLVGMAVTPSRAHVKALRQGLVNPD